MIRVKRLPKYRRIVPRRHFLSGPWRIEDAQGNRWKLFVGWWVVTW